MDSLQKSLSETEKSVLNVKKLVDTCNKVIYLGHGNNFIPGANPVCNHLYIYNCKKYVVPLSIARIA
jgi:hypothetical protein